MKKIKILGIAPYEGLELLMKQYALKYKNKVDLTSVFGNMEAGAQLACELYSDYDVIISRGRTANMILDKVSIPVIDIGLNHYDVLRCIKIAESTKSKFAILGYHSLTDIAESLADLLKTHYDIFSCSTKDEARIMLDQLKSLGYTTVICDTMPYEYAKIIGITPIMLTSSVESLKKSIDTAIRTWQNNENLYQSIGIMKHILNESSNMYVVLDGSGNTMYSTLRTKDSDKILSALKEELPSLFSVEERSFFITIGNRMYSVLAYTHTESSLFVSFTIMPSMIPLGYSRYGITILDKKTALKNFMDSYYSNTEIYRDLSSYLEHLSEAPASLMVAGEIGTGKDHVAHILYVKSIYSDNPLYVINCSLLTDKTWDFLVNNYNSPFTDNGNTIYIANINSLSEKRMKHLLSIILDTNLHNRNHLIFSCMIGENGIEHHTVLQLINAISCLVISLDPVRKQMSAMLKSSSLYIDTLNQTFGTQVIDLSAEAAAEVCSYSWPQNITQFKRVLKSAVLETQTSYITDVTIRRLIDQECLLLPHGGMTSDTVKSSSISLNLNRPLDEINYDIIKEVLKNCDGKQTVAAKKLGISRTTLWRYINR